MLPEDDYRTRIGKCYSCLGKKKKAIADLIRSAPLKVVGMTIGDLAAYCQCHQTTIVHFARELGYKGYPDLKLAIARKSDALWKQVETQKVSRLSQYENLCLNLTQMLHKAVENTLQRIPEAKITDAVQYLKKASRIMICGSGTSALAAEDLSFKLTRLGFPVCFSRDAEVWKSLFGLLKKNDVLVIYSHSGETSPYKEILKKASEHSIVTLGITSRLDSSVGNFSTLVLQTDPGMELPIRLGAMASRSGQLALGDLITIKLSQQDKQHSWETLEALYESYLP